ncbi:phage holin family protein [Zhongshania sp.]|jgi:uncharacterized membrane protein YqjE|uniref:phage holin family protein n=1 Tax=Zhongshania sp. TaxID=1971902 RepID=UPI002A7FC202|nr:phage holin family protein [Zhongshania sp.]
MTRTRENENSGGSGSTENSVNMADVVNLFRTADYDALFAQANLHRQLAEIEWQEEKQRLSSLFTALLIGIPSFICLLIFLGILVITLTWNTDYRSASLLGLCIMYGLATFIAWKRFMLEAKRPGRFFKGSREEIAADLAVIKKKFE